MTKTQKAKNFGGQGRMLYVMVSESEDGGGRRNFGIKVRASLLLRKYVQNGL